MLTSTVRDTTVRRTRMLPAMDMRCPYCGGPIELFVDGFAGDQQYIEDCQVCCRPIVVTVALDADGEPVVAVRAEDEACGATAPPRACRSVARAAAVPGKVVFFSVPLRASAVPHGSRVRAGSGFHPKS